MPPNWSRKWPKVTNQSELQRITSIATVCVEYLCMVTSSSIWLTWIAEYTWKFQSINSYSSRWMQYMKDSKNSIWWQGDFMEFDRRWQNFGKFNSEKQIWKHVKHYLIKFSKMPELLLIHSLGFLLKTFGSSQKHVSWYVLTDLNDLFHHIFPSWRWILICHIFQKTSKKKL